VAGAFVGRKTLIAIHDMRIVIYHMRKGCGVDGDDIAGGRASLGVCDVAIEFPCDKASSAQDIQSLARRYVLSVRSRRSMDTTTASGSCA
jgi:hypothetical protein